MSKVLRAEPPRRRLTLAEIERRPEFQELRPKQKLFCLSYLRSGVDTGTFDAVFAASTAYDATSRPENFRLISYELLESPRIKKVLALYFGTKGKRK